MTRYAVPAETRFHWLALATGPDGKSTEGKTMATEQRAPYPRSANNADKMNLPEGKTCGDCAHCRRCTSMFGHIPEDESYDWSPSRFTPVKIVA
jgi:hypothetical protein